MRITKDNYLNQLKRHNEKALEYVLEEYGGFLMSIIRKHLYSLPAFHEDCLNDVLFKIWKHIGQFDENKSTFKNWIAAIARYQSIDYLRKYLCEYEHTNLDEVSLALEDRHLVKLIEEEISAEVSSMLNCLSEEDKILFLKLFYKEEDISDVSREMHLTKSVIYNRISRGKRKLRKLFRNWSELS